MSSGEAKLTPLGSGVRADPPRIRLRAVFSMLQKEYKAFTSDLQAIVDKYNVARAYPPQRCYVCDPEPDECLECEDDDFGDEYWDATDTELDMPNNDHDILRAIIARVLCTLILWIPRLGQLIETIAVGLLFVQLADHCDSALALCNADCGLREGVHNRRSLDAEVRRASQTLISAQKLLKEMQELRDRRRMEARVKVFDSWMLQKLDQRVEAFDRVHELLHRTAEREVEHLRTSILVKLKANRSE